VILRGLDFTPADDIHLTPQTPIIVVMHGLTGGMQHLYDSSHSLNLIIKPCQGSYESYVRAVLAPACTPVHQGGLGYRAVVVNFRGC